MNTSSDPPPAVEDRATRLSDLLRPFDEIFRDTRGGATFDYFTGEQGRSRLLEVFGPGGCESRIIQHGIDHDAGEVWVLVELTVRVIEHDPNDRGSYVTRTVVHQEFGSQKIKRGRNNGAVLDLGFDLKGATTDGLKKAMSNLGIGLYLWKKREGGRPAIPDEGLPDNAFSDASPNDREASPARATRTTSGSTGKAATERPARTTTGPTRQPPAPATREQIDRYEPIRAEAVAFGYRSSWVDEDSSRWTEGQITNYTRLLEQYLERSQRGAA